MTYGSMTFGLITSDKPKKKTKTTKTAKKKTSKGFATDPAFKVGSKVYTIMPMDGQYPRTYVEVRANSMNDLRAKMIKYNAFKQDPLILTFKQKFAENTHVWLGPKPNPIPDGWFKYGFEGYIQKKADGTYVWQPDGKYDGDARVVNPNGSLGRITEVD